MEAFEQLKYVELSAEQIRDEIRMLYHRDAPGDHDDMMIYLLQKMKP